jgi:hypothetical protein
MTGFLDAERRHQLICDLQSLSMRSDTAMHFANVSDNLRHLDRHLSSLVGRLGERFRQLVEATRNGNESKRRQCLAYFEADLAIFRAYAAEAAERRLTSRGLPRTAQAIADIIASSEAQEQTASLSINPK